ncbi:hypothetical protein ACQEVC_45505 [Plantactinospora sp. CA-294935]|uniref:hypothetical protein n=1 Tax=Plantactinospora sp. CA-294935 TaxID=3240012 RepID=UPI003D9162E8
MSDEPHAVAILDLLRAVDGLVVYPPADGEGDGQIVPTSASPPYVVAYIQVTYALGPTIDLLSSRAVARVTCHSVGQTDIAARVVANRVRSALLDVVPVIAGRKPYPIRSDDGQPPRPDESTGRLVVDQIDIYRLESLPG